MLTSHYNSIFGYFRKLVFFLSGRLPMLFSRSGVAVAKNAVRSEIIALEDYAAVVELDPVLFDGAFETKTSDRAVVADGVAKNVSASAVDVEANSSADTVTVKANFEYRTEIFHWGKVFSDGVTHVSVYASDGNIRDEHSSHHRIAAPRSLKKSVATSYTGTTLHLGAEISTLSGNIAHWVLDAMGRLLLLEDRVFTPIKVDRYLIPPNQPEFVRCLVDLGIDKNKLLEMPINETVQFEKLLCVSNPCGRSSHVTPEWLIDCYRRKYEDVLQQGEKKQTRIYISRRDASARKVRSEDKLIQELEARGFDIIEGSKYSLREKVRLFSEASEVIGLSGAGLIGLLFCRPDARVVEIYPSYFVNYHFASICSVLGHDHHPYISGCESVLSKINPFAGECDLDVKEFVDFYDSLDAPCGEKQAV